MAPELVLDTTGRAVARGRLAVATYDWRPEYERLSPSALLRRLRGVEPAERSAVDNILCVAGLSYFVLALAWSSSLDQNDQMGDPLTLTTMAPMWGAIGTGTTAVADTDSQLTAEAARSVVMAVGTTAASHSIPASVVWSFLFPTPAVTTVIAEAGMFLNGAATANSGQLFDHALISPTVSQATNQIATLTASMSFGNT